ncbi:G-type lectin S-receptor-like serine/threonine-protein kinase At1g11303 [Cryptomeria japonica]|uniref:G-type lectin S-receptor-like serine/threonine-protein kinase At1g11303 n=1 Tax=Cryptomeria japonica TaxID=3369 RepID=UPI0027DAB529|nr:G-type lectin S-receptor-like serine/threonine-protein kinase At1g11303 [Cryptomeria japonica]
MGFFSPNGTNKWYVGIWYAQNPDKNIVWVANRETPVRDMPGVCTLSSTGYLTLSDLQGKAIWSSNNTQQTQYKNGVSFYSTGEWIGSYFSTLPGAKSDPLFTEELVVFSPTRMYYTYGQRAYTQSWSDNGDGSSQLQRCVQGFHPRNATTWTSQEWWSSGCVRRTPLNCTTDGFLQVSDKSLSDEEAVQYSQQSTLLGCKTACLNNCSCTVFAVSNSNPLSAHAGRGSNRVVALSVSISLGLALLSALFILAWFIQRRRRRLVEKFVKDDTSTSLRAFSYKELKVANKNFALKLGKGAFGSVFKGTLLDKSLVAVKKLEGFVQAKSS